MNRDCESIRKRLTGCGRTGVRRCSRSSRPRVCGKALRESRRSRGCILGPYQVRPQPAAGERDWARSGMDEEVWCGVRWGEVKASGAYGWFDGMLRDEKWLAVRCVLWRDRTVRIRSSASMSPSTLFFTGALLFTDRLLIRPARSGWQVRQRERHD